MKFTASIDESTEKTKSISNTHEVLKSYLKLQEKDEKNEQRYIYYFVIILLSCGSISSKVFKEAILFIFQRKEKKKTSLKFELYFESSNLLRTNLNGKCKIVTK